MNRRHLLALAAGVMAAPPVEAGPPPSRVALIDGGWDGEARLAGIAVDLDDGWKTYWRVPGDAGIPPEFTWDASRNSRAIDVLYPLPQRFEDASGEAIGYKHRVVFPVRIEPVDRAAAIDLSLAMFFGVCREVCVPRQAKVQRLLPPQARDEGVAGWLSQVPRPAPAAPPVTEARVEVQDGKPQLVLTLAAPVSDIFVEGAGDAYFQAPQFAGANATIGIGNVRDALALRGAALKLTLTMQGQGVEQQLTLP